MGLSMIDRDWDLADEAATHAFGTRFANALDGGIVVYLYGELGAGKTSFARAMLTALGVGERIKSPTYSLIEGYQSSAGPAWHLDLYRIADPGELEWLGLDALSDSTAVVLIEWPERGKGALPASDLELKLTYSGVGRNVAAHPRTRRGEQLLARLE
jgi:tRNA threonylcarbamoyladenosine biosynthesis protein TsaE